MAHSRGLSVPLLTDCCFKYDLRLGSFFIGLMYAMDLVFDLLGVWFVGQFSWVARFLSTFDSSYRYVIKSGYFSLISSKLPSYDEDTTASKVGEGMLKVFSMVNLAVNGLMVVSLILLILKDDVDLLRGWVIVKLFLTFMDTFIMLFSDGVWYTVLFLALVVKLYWILVIYSYSQEGRKKERRMYNVFY